MKARKESSIAEAHRVFKPVAMGYVIVSFAREWQLDEGLRALVELGFGREIMHRGDDPLVVATIAQDLTSVGLRNESWLTDAERDFAQRGTCWLVIRAQSDGRAFQIADCLTSCGATSVQYYGNLVVEELLDKAGGPATGKVAPTGVQARGRAEPANDASAAEV